MSVTSYQLLEQTCLSKQTLKLNNYQTVALCVQCHHQSKAKGSSTAVGRILLRSTIGGERLPEEA